MVKTQSPFFSLPIGLREAIYDMLLPHATLDQYQRLQWHQGETAMLYVSRRINEEASRRLYRCLDVFYFTDDDCDACLNVVPDLCREVYSDFSELLIRYLLLLILVARYSTSRLRVTGLW